MPSPGGSDINAEAGGSYGEDRERNIQPGTQENDNSDNLNDYECPGLIDYGRGIDGNFCINQNVTRGMLTSLPTSRV
jgi:hypothetical protein